MQQEIVRLNAELELRQSGSFSQTKDCTVVTRVSAVFYSAGPKNQKEILGNGIASTPGRKGSVVG